MNLNHRPGLTIEPILNKFLQQITQYVRHYGPGTIIWHGQYVNFAHLLAQDVRSSIHHLALLPLEESEQTEVKAETMEAEADVVEVIEVHQDDFDVGPSCRVRLRKGSEECIAKGDSHTPTLAKMDAVQAVM